MSSRKGASHNLWGVILNQYSKNPGCFHVSIVKTVFLLDCRPECVHPVIIRMINVFCIVAEKVTFNLLTRIILT